MAGADLVVSTTGATEPIVSLERYQKLEAGRYQRPLFVLDLAVPRDFDPAVAKCLGVYLYSVDDLRETCEANQKARHINMSANHTFSYTSLVCFWVIEVAVKRGKKL